jgi:phage antirepressor YoqD-like protein
MITTLLPISAQENTLLVSTLDFAEGLAIQHKNLLETIMTYLPTIEKGFGQVAFQTETVTNSVGAVNQIKFALLTEDQALFVGSLSRNSERVVEFKSVLVRSFAEARKRLAVQPAPYFLPQTKAEALRALAEEIEAHEATQLQLEAAKPKIEQYERTMNAEGTFSVGDVAKMIGTGQNRLFDFLRNQNVLFHHRGHNQPYQQYVDNGWFRVVQTTYPHGERQESYPKVFVLPKGVEGIRKKWDAAHRPAVNDPAIYQSDAHGIA